MFQEVTRKFQASLLLDEMNAVLVQCWPKLDPVGLHLPSENLYQQVAYIVGNLQF